MNKAGKEKEAGTAKRRGRMNVRTQTERKGMREGRRREERGRGDKGGREKGEGEE